MSFTLISSSVLSLWLTTTLDCWQWTEYAASFIVILGVLGEYLAEFHIFQKPEEEKKRRKVTKRSTLFLLGGLAIELLALVRTSQLYELKIADLNTKAAEANERAGKLEPRHVTLDQRKKILELLRSKKGTKVVIDPIISEGGDTFSYAREIVEVFHDAKDAHWDADNFLRLVTMDTPLHGFLIEIQHDSAFNTELADLTEKALRLLDSRVTQKRIPPDPNSSCDIIVLVGGK